ncbi:hypothetical protein Tco_0709087 [Tanacetum coccineum]
MLFSNTKLLISAAQSDAPRGRCYTETALTMIREVSNDEIRVALHDIDDNKAPGPDGFTSRFFKASWETIGKDFCSTVKEFFSSGKCLVN